MMNNQLLKESISFYAKQLRIPTFGQYESVLRHMDSQKSYGDFLYELMKNELENRRQNQQKRRIRSAGFPYLKTLDEYDFNRLPNVKEAFLRELSTCYYITKHQNVLLIGPPGTGKSHLSIGLGLIACKEGFQVKFQTAASMATELSEAQEYKRLGKLQKTLSTVDLLILDELSYSSFNRYQSELLFNVISERAERGSVIVTTNLPFSKWTELFDNPMMVAAMVDRLTYHSHVLDMNGPSYRLSDSEGGGQKRLVV